MALKGATGKNSVHKSGKKANNKKKSIQCKICLKSFVREKHLEWHSILFHLGDTPEKNCADNKSSPEKKSFQCKQCEKTFFRPEYLKNHIKTVHLKDKIYTCDIVPCIKKFVHLSSFKRHKRDIHSKGNITPQYFCNTEKCQKTFVDRGNFLKHFLRHFTSKCNFCKRKIFNSYMDEHISSQHNSKKPTITTQNSKNIQTSVQRKNDKERKKKLTNHNANNATLIENENSFHHETTATTTTTQEHKFTSTNTEENDMFTKCYICGKVFEFSFNLLNHITNDHKLKIIKCPMCPNSFFFGEDNYKPHVIKHHNQF